MYDFIDEDKLAELILSKVQELVPVDLIESIVTVKNEVGEALAIIKEFNLQGGIDAVVNSAQKLTLEKLDPIITSLISSSLLDVKQAISVVKNEFEHHLAQIVPQLQNIDLSVISGLKDSMSDMSKFETMIFNTLANQVGLESSELKILFQNLKSFLDSPTELLDSLKTKLVDTLYAEFSQLTDNLINPSKITSLIEGQLGEFVHSQIDQIKDVLMQQLASPDVIKLIDTHLGGVISRYESFVGQKLETARNVINSISNTVNTVLVKYEEIKAILDVLPNFAQGFTESFKDQIEGQLTTLMSTLPSKVMTETKAMLLSYLDDFLKSIF